MTSPSQIESNIAKVFRGKPGIVRKAVLCLLSEGHLLIEDIPGVGKTTLALALAKSLDLTFQRVQFTSDLLPSDILGVSIYDTKSGKFEFKQGPIFHQVILADEINRSTPKAQSALLEAMNERQVSMDGRTHTLPEPFFVIATQNPYEHYGTYPLPESQRDRFLMRLSIGYPEPQDEKQVLQERINTRSIEALKAIMNRDEVMRLFERVGEVKVDGSLDDYILRIVKETRESPFLELGVSPRGSIALRRVAQANALVEGREFVTPDDIKQNASAVLAHRVMLKSVNGEPEAAASEKIIRDILDRAAVPL